MDKMMLDFAAELRIEKDDDTPHIRGHAAVFDKPVQIFKDFNEQVARGAFTNTILKDDIRALRNHTRDYVLGRNRAGTLILEEDKRGLLVDIMPPDAVWAKDFMKSIERGDITGMSFGFNILRESWDEKKRLSTLHEVKLFEVSPVTFPAYPQTDVSVRAIFDEAGIDYDVLYGAMVKCDRRIDTDEDRDIIKRSMEALQNMIAKTVDGTREIEGKESQAAYSVELLKQKLEIIKIG